MISIIKSITNQSLIYIAIILATLSFLSFSPISAQEKRYGNGFWEVKWSPDGLLLAIGDDDGGILIRDLNGNIIMRFSGHPPATRSITWSPDQNFIASGGEDGSIRIWDTRTGRLTHEIENFSEVTAVVAWRPTGDQLIASGFNEFGSWDTETWEPLTGRLSTTNSAMKWNPDGSEFAFYSMAGLGIMSIENGTIYQRYMDKKHNGFVYGIDWSADGSLLISAGEDGNIYLWDAENNQYLETILETNQRFWDISFVNNKSERVIAITADGYIYDIDLQTRKFDRRPVENMFMTSVDWNPYTNMLAISGVTILPLRSETSSEKTWFDSGFIEIRPVDMP